MKKHIVGIQISTGHSVSKFQKCLEKAFLDNAISANLPFSSVQFSSVYLAIKKQNKQIISSFTLKSVFNLFR